MFLSATNHGLHSPFYLCQLSSRSFGVFDYASDILQVISLAFFTSFRPQVLSHRKFDIEYLRRFVKTKLEPGKFLVVHGPKGIGKSCAIETALADFRAVFMAPSIPPDTRSTEILQIVLSKLTKTDIYASDRASTICYLYKWAFKETPVIVLRADERLISIFCICNECG